MQKSDRDCPELRNSLQPLVLIVDDEESMVDACKQVLTRQNYRVEYAYNGLDGLKVFQKTMPDLVILDLKMPGMSGMELLQRLKKTDPDIVIIVITGYATIEFAVEAIKNGAFDFLPKPFSGDAIKMIVKRGMERRRLLKSAEKAEREKREIEENFMTFATHQMKSHIAVIQQYFEVMLSGFTGQIPEPQRAILGKTMPRLEELRSIIDDWLGLSRINYDEIHERFARIDLNTMLAGIINAHEPLATQRGITLELKADQEDMVITGDKLTLEQAITNLIVNAIKYNKDKGNVQVIITKDSKKTIIEVTDTGMGISKEEIPLIFEQFYRGINVRHQHIKGTGLGLAITKKILDMHHAKIECESTLDKGTSFRVIFPC